MDTVSPNAGDLAATAPVFSTGGGIGDVTPTPIDFGSGSAPVAVPAPPVLTLMTAVAPMPVAIPNVTDAAQQPAVVVSNVASLLDDAHNEILLAQHALVKAKAKARSILQTVASHTETVYASLAKLASEAETTLAAIPSEIKVSLISDKNEIEAVAVAEDKKVVSFFDRIFGVKPKT